jgi:hypothetical protein
VAEKDTEGGAEPLTINALPLLRWIFNAERIKRAWRKTRRPRETRK